MIRPGRRHRIRQRTLETLRSQLRDVRPVGERPLVDLFRREQALDLEAVEQWLPAHASAELEAAGLIARDDGRVQALARLDPIEQVLIASDLNRRHGAADFVVGPGPSSLLLAGHVPQQRGGTLLDLGSGSGVQGLIRGDRSTRVTAIDINPRAVAFTRFNAGINRHRRIYAAVGDFLGDEPDRGLDGRFNTAVANPPFVLSPRHAFTYRDRPLPGDEVSARTVERVARALAPGGRGYILCDWIDRGETWSDPVRGWTSGLRCDVTATRIRTLEPSAYASIWTRALPVEQRPAAIRSWAGALEAEGIERIHVGVIALARAGRWSSGSFEPRDARSLAAAG